MQYRTFTTQVHLNGGQQGWFTVPSALAAQLGGEGHPLPVCGQVDSLAYRGVLWPEEGGGWFVELSPELLASGRFEDGLEVDATIACDDEPREATIPYELTETLGMAPIAERAWEKLGEAERAPYCEWVSAALDNHERWKRAERAAVLVRRGEKLEMQAH